MFFPPSTPSKAAYFEPLICAGGGLGFNTPLNFCPLLAGYTLVHIPLFPPGFIASKYPIWFGIMHKYLCALMQVKTLIAQAWS